ncbi:MAG: hypothetical protein E6R10_00495 [Rhodocyclaceae bacterium]|nr:MAG: hypothetical protein E6R10_00495 [Rhodocyclaceae bacterium]
MSRWLALLALLLCSASALAQARIVVCYNYGCLNSTTVTYSRQQLLQVRDLLDDAVNAAHERELIGVVIGRLLGWAGKQSPIHADRGGNFADDGVYGRMDCIDHSTTTTRLLRMLERRGWLRWHHVLAPEVRTRLVIFDHWSAVIEEAPKAPFRDEHPLSRTRYAVDSWFFDNGQPAVVMPLDEWMDWEGPRVE